MCCSWYFLHQSRNYFEGIYPTCIEEIWGVFWFCFVFKHAVWLQGWETYFNHVNFPCSFPFSERGVVWEETIILLPDNVHYVFLSATIPNARQFAEWICHLHKQVIFLIHCTTMLFVLWCNTVWLVDNWTPEYLFTKFITYRWYYRSLLASLAVFLLLQVYWVLLLNGNIRVIS